MHTRPYEKLIVWQEAHRLCLMIYRITDSFPTTERYGLTSQMRRSSYSVPMNLAEGNMKRSWKEKTHYIDIAIGSLEELHYQAFLSRDLSYIKAATFDEADAQIQRVSYLLTRLRTTFGK